MSDMELLNELPQGWKWVKLGDVCEITSSRRIFENEYVKNGIPFFRTKEIVELNEGKNITVEIFISNEKYQAIKKNNQVPKKGDLLISAVGTIGIVYIIPDDKEFYFKDGNLLWIRELKEVDCFYLKFVLDNYFKFLNNLTNGSTYNALTIVKLKEVEIPLPKNIQEQQRLAKLLTEKLAIVEQAKQKITTQLQAAQDLTAAYLREVFESEEAKGWEWVKFEEIADFKNGINFNASQKGSGLLTIDVFNMYSNSIYIENNEEFYRIIGKINEEYLLNDNDILFVRSSVKKEGVGWTTLFKTHSENVTFCGFLIRARMKIECYQEFIVFYFRSPLARQEIIGKAGSSTITNISQENLKSFLIPLPPVDKQQEIANYLTEKFKTVEQLKTTLQTQLNSINQLPAALLKQAFSGQL